jgi:hypothetical protein
MRPGEHEGTIRMEVHAALITCLAAFVAAGVPARVPASVAPQWTRHLSATETRNVSTGNHTKLHKYFRDRQHRSLDGPAELCKKKKAKGEVILGAGRN